MLLPFVPKRMFLRSDYFEVIEIVIEPVSVLVMNKFKSSKFSSYEIFHDQTMLISGDT